MTEFATASETEDALADLANKQRDLIAELNEEKIALLEANIRLIASIDSVLACPRLPSCCAEELREARQKVGGER